MTWKRIIELILVFSIGILLGYYLKPNPVLKIPNVEILVKDSIIRDSIYLINDSIRTKILYIEQKHDKETSTIMSSSDSAQFEFFKRYLENYKRTITSN